MKKVNSINSLGRNPIQAFLIAYPALPLILIMIVVFSFLAPSFLAAMTFQTAVKGNTVILIGAVAQTLVLLTGGIDLSVSTVIAVSAVCSGLYMHGSGPESILVGLIIAVGVGLVFGCVNGLMVGYGGMQPFIVTMGTRLIARGIAMVLTTGVAVAGCPKELIMFGFKTYFGIPSIFLVGLGTVLVMAIVVKKSQWGRNLILFGANRHAAEYSGINIKKVEATSYIMSGAISGLAGFISIISLGCALPGVGDTILLMIIGGVVLGGTSMFGGEGNVMRTLIGVGLLAILSAGLDALAMPFYNQQIIQGVLIFIGYSLTVQITSRSSLAMK